MSCLSTVSQSMALEWTGRTNNLFTVIFQLYWCFDSNKIKLLRRILLLPYFKLKYPMFHMFIVIHGQTTRPLQYLYIHR